MHMDGIAADTREGKMKSKWAEKYFKRIKPKKNISSTSTQTCVQSWEHCDLPAAASRRWPSVLPLLLLRRIRLPPAGHKAECARSSLETAPRQLHDGHVEWWACTAQIEPNANASSALWSVLTWWGNRKNTDFSLAVSAKSIVLTTVFKRPRPTFWSKLSLFYSSLPVACASLNDEAMLVYVHTGVAVKLRVAHEVIITGIDRRRRHCANGASRG